ncbi:hypothetical protein, partial [Streptomyces sp. NPDC051162]|uniref:hypothetical protein n=1 Tax=Streptomyces sp. NPDC051162 TaxID=3154747 RepID=UPI0034331DD8
MAEERSSRTTTATGSPCRENCAASRLSPRKPVICAGVRGARPTSVTRPRRKVSVMAHHAHPQPKQRSWFARHKVLTGA